MNKAWDKVKEVFCAHPHESGESYGGHLGFALGIAARLAYASCTALIHGIFPFCCTYSTSRQLLRIRSIIHEREKRHAKAVTEQAEQPEDA